MAIRVACLDCGHRFVPAAVTGKKGSACPQCGSTAQIQLLESPRVSAAEGGESPSGAPADTARDDGLAAGGGGGGGPAAAGDSTAPGREPVPTAAAPPGRKARPRWFAPAVVAAWGAALILWAVLSAWRPGDGDGPAARRPEPAGPQRAAAPSIPSGPEQPRPGAEGPDEAPPGAIAASAPEAAGGESSPAEPTAPSNRVEAEDRSAGTEPTAEAAAGGTERPGGPVPVARSLDEAKRALVKLEIPLGLEDALAVGLMEHAAGFVMDSRGWIATNHHVLATMTKAARAKLADGTRCALAGIVARSPERDLAILQLKEPFPELTVLDIGYDGDPRLGQQVFAFGHPYDADFSLSKGIVSNVQTTAQLTEGAPDHLLARLPAPADMVWIQHDAKISPGNSGGPLIDESARVFGVNTFLHRKAEFGYASHVRHLRELAESASAEIQPLPDAPAVLRTVVSSNRINELFATAQRFRWNPKSAEEYGVLAELAKQLTLARHARGAAARMPAARAAVVQRVALLADQKYDALRRLSWSQDQFAAINGFAAGQIDQVGEGAFLCSVAMGSIRERNALLMEIEGWDKLFVLPVGPKAPRLPPGSRWLVLGFITPRVVQVRNPQESTTRPARVILTHHMLLLRPSGRGAGQRSGAAAEPGREASP